MKPFPNRKGSVLSGVMVVWTVSIEGTTLSGTATLMVLVDVFVIPLTIVVQVMVAEMDNPSVTRGA